MYKTTPMPPPLACTTDNKFFCIHIYEEKSCLNCLKNCMENEREKNENEGPGGA